MAWVIPALTGSLLIKLGTDADTWLGWVGVALGCFQIFAAVVVAWARYGIKV